MVEVSPLTNSIELLQKFGFFQVVLPMILVFAVIFGILEKFKIFGEDRTNINAVVAFVIAFFTITSTPIVEAMNNLIPQTSLLLVVALLAIMLFAFFGLNPQDKFEGMGKWAWLGALVLIIIFLGILDASFGWNIPGVHQGVQAIVGGEGGEGGGAGAGEGAGNWWETEAFQMFLSLLLLFLIPFIVVFYVVRKK